MQRGAACAEFRDEQLTEIALEPVLPAWWRPFTGPFLYYPSRRYLPAPLRAFVDFIADRRG